MEEGLGRIVVKGITYREMLNTKKGLMIGFFSALFASIICFIILISSLLGYVNIKGSGLIPAAIIILPLLISTGATWAFNPRRWDWLDIIYENGISSSLGPFLPFSEIDKIAYGKIDDGSNFIQLFSKTRSWKICPDIRENKFKNNYYEQAIQILKQKCPNVPWVEMEWLEWK